jgi:hypothetical protein
LEYAFNGGSKYGDNYEPEAAMKWANTLPPGPARDATLREIRMHTAKPKP